MKNSSLAALVLAGLWGGSIDMAEMNMDAPYTPPTKPAAAPAKIPAPR